MKRLLILIGIVGTILLGIGYRARLFGPMEVEVALWGNIALVFSIGLLGIVLWKGMKASIFLASGSALIALLHLIPILFWAVVPPTDNLTVATSSKGGFFIILHLVLLTTALIVSLTSRKVSTVWQQ